MLEALLCAGAVLALLVALVVGAVVVYRLERREWNGGVSPTGEPWRHFDTDSYGSRGYKNSAGDVCWISWRSVDRRPAHPMRRSSDRCPRYDE